MMHGTINIKYKTHLTKCITYAFWLRQDVTLIYVQGTFLNIL